MEYSLTIDRFENEKAVLKTEKGETIIWPKDKLPAEAKEGAVLIFTIAGNKEKERNKKDLAKDILNELLNTEEN
ncbi:MAG: DUF3006 domain-containing protein [Patescibacteria group bacterium]|nr:DUF3006 domain-containing protein [Patescibacteria group bacterium]MDD5294698.1 DUF3006 domain-containing protein [Patescibacteria group bacterium]MDD5554683.1 DUF3006 domain-containing protein [Patescibacteria group bacterium]